MEIIFCVLGKPVAKGRPRATTRGKFATVFTDAKTKAAEQSVLAQALPYKPDTPLTGPLKVFLGFIMPIPKSRSKKWKAAAADGTEYHTGKPDTDNLIKLTLDALNGVFWLDDSQVVEVTGIKAYGPVPMTRVRIEAI